jgi:hypothetical protein
MTHKSVTGNSGLHLLIRRTMETSEISALAKTHAEAILAIGLTKAEIVMLLAVIEARLTQAIVATAPGAAPVVAGVVAKPWTPGAKIAEKGYPCVCVMCSKHIYTVNKDVYDNTVVKDFIDSYTPMPGYQPITKQTKISNIDNNITMSCPDCGGDLTLYLAGRQIG